jgi:hypothetical protein
LTTKNKISQPNGLQSISIAVFICLKNHIYLFGWLFFGFNRAHLKKSAGYDFAGYDFGIFF